MEGMEVKIERQTNKSEKKTYSTQFSSLLSCISQYSITVAPPPGVIHLHPDMLLVLETYSRRGYME